MTSILYISIKQRRSIRTMLRRPGDIVRPFLRCRIFRLGQVDIPTRVLNYY